MSDNQVALTLRMPAELHELLTVRSLVEEVSINELVLRSLYSDGRNKDVRYEAIRKLVHEVREG